MKNNLLALAILTLTLFSCGFNQNKSHQKHAIFKDEMTLEKKIQIAANIVPTPLQLQRQNMELAALLPFGINTFTGKEWGTGKDDLSLFNPINLNADQWIKTLKDNGFELAILTAKHHEGFCLWPTATSSFSVAQTPWKNGKGDIVRDVKEACDKYGLKFGLYISLWDRHATSFGTVEYTNEFINQLTELLSNYGEIYELWLDGSYGEDPSIGIPEYDYIKINKAIKSIQPNTLVSMMGEDIRWIGNEIGKNRDTEWSVTALIPPNLKSADSTNKQLMLNLQSPDLGSREIIDKSNELHWYPAEMNVSIRPSWFYHPEEDDEIKSVADLVNLYIHSVGNNSLLLLGIPPNREGLISEKDSIRLNEFSEYLNCFKTNNLIKSPSLRYEALEGDSIWFELDENKEINTLLVQEMLEYGQHIENFRIEAAINNEWHTVYTGTTVGQKKIIQLAKPIVTKDIRLILDQSRGVAYINKLGAYDCVNPKQKSSIRVLNEFGTYRWQVLRPLEEGESIIDNNITTYWYGKGDIIIDLRKEEEFSGFVYTPALETKEHINLYSFSISQDNILWTPVLENEEFSNIKNNPTIQRVRFSDKQTARYIKLSVHKSANFKSSFSIAELGLLK